jgi:hypothetical protein
MSLRRDDRSNFGRELALAPPVMATMRRRRSARWARRRFKTSGTANVADFEYAAFDDRQRYSVQLLGCAEQRTSEIHASAAPRHLVTFDMIPLPRHDNAARPSFLGFYKHVVCQPVCNHLHRVEAGNDNRFLGALCLEKFNSLDRKAIALADEHCSQRGQSRCCTRERSVRASASPLCRAMFYLCGSHDAIRASYVG